MAEPGHEPKMLLREDLSKEYYAIVDVVSSYDGWLLIVKGWSVTLSLTGLGLAFQQGHVALFGLAALTGAGFWFLDGLMKGYQYRYYVRMREIEYTAYLINPVLLEGEYPEPVSAPRIDMTWEFQGYPVRSSELARHHDVRAAPPTRRSPEQIHWHLRSRFWWPNVALPHAIAVVLGLALFVAATLDAPGLEGLPL